MSKQFRPMLAASLKRLNQIKYPTLATPKIDGIRCLIRHGLVVSRSLKPIPNNFIQQQLKDLPSGLDGELVLNTQEGFSAISSAVMSVDGEPDFSFVVFDNFAYQSHYQRRIEQVHGWWTKHRHPRVLPLLPREINNEEEFLTYVDYCLDDLKVEGVILRQSHTSYKHGRSTLRDQGMIKYKAFEDDEAEVIGMIELLHNENEITEDELGLSTRSSHKDGKRACGKLGALRVKDLKTGVEFKIGTGFDDKTRDEIWSNAADYMGQFVKYRHMPHGRKEKPRHPVFLGFRHPDDM